MYSLSVSLAFTEIKIFYYSLLILTLFTVSVNKKILVRENKSGIIKKIDKKPFFGKNSLHLSYFSKKIVFL